MSDQSNEAAPVRTQGVTFKRRNRMRHREFLASLSATLNTIDGARARAAAKHTSMEMLSTGHDKPAAAEPLVTSAALEVASSSAFS